MKSAGFKTKIQYLKEFRYAGVNLFSFALRGFYFRMRGKNILAHQCVIIKGLKNIQTRALLSIGTSYVGFMHRRDKTYLNIEGKLNIEGEFSIGRGCRILIGENAQCTLRGGYMTANTNFIILNGLEIGNDCAIAWGCEFLDHDFHQIEYEGRQETDSKIKIGNHVWIGSNVKVLKGVTIGNNNVVAANSMVTRSFPEEHVLIAGSPAKIIKTNISWS